MEGIPEGMGFPKYERARQKVASRGSVVTLDLFNSRGGLVHQCTDRGSELMELTWGGEALSSWLSGASDAPALNPTSSNRTIRSLQHDGWKMMGTINHGKFGGAVFWRNNHVVIAAMGAGEAQTIRVSLEPGWHLQGLASYPNHLRLLTAHEPTNCYEHLVVYGRHSVWHSALKRRRSLVTDLLLPAVIGLAVGVGLSILWDKIEASQGEEEDRR